MARIYPFRAWRFNPAMVRLDDVVTQPCDTITPALQQAYYQKSPYNLIRITLGLPELFDAEKGESVYTRAARDFSRWREQGVLVQESEPCIFACTQHFTVPGTSIVKERCGFIALGKLHEYSEQVVFRHEQTVAAPEDDSLKLLKATRAHFGQILMLYSDPAGSIDSLLFNAGSPADAEVTDQYGVLHRLWRVNDPATLRLLTSAMEDKKLILADGHHRYETALNYGRAFASEYAARHHSQVPGKAEFAATQLPHPAFPEEASMMTFVNMDADGLVILPTHRVLHGLTGFNAGNFATAASAFFSVTQLPATDAECYLQTLQAQNGTAFVAVTGSGALLLQARPDAVAAALPELPTRQRQLDSLQLHALLLDHVLGLNTQKLLEESNLCYLSDAAEAVGLVRRGEADIAFLTNPVTLNQLREVAFAGELMPHNSTDFYPGLLSGLAVYSLD